MDPYEENQDVTLDNQGTGEGAGGDDDSGGGDEPRVYRNQEEVDAAIERRLAQERRKLASMFGVNKLEEAVPFFQAGAAVSKASGLKPTEVVGRLQNPQQQQQQQFQPQPGVGADPQLNQRLDRIEGMLESDKTEKLRTSQEAEAKKEFGELYDQHKYDIEDKAEEMGLSLVDAATIVLRPKLEDHIAKQQQTKQQEKQQKRLESSDESGKSGKQVDLNTALSPEEKRVAQKMGISYQKYYDRKVKSGKA